MSVTIKDIAKKAGVSHTTVSRALNGNPCIPDKTTALIRDIAGEMGYLPSATARGLKTRHTRALGVLVNRIDNPYFGEILQGIEDAVKDAGYSIFIASSFTNPKHEKHIIQAFSEHRVDGVIIGSVPVNQESYNLLDKYGIPAVVINNQSHRNHKYTISHDDFYGAQQVARHLLDLGHQHIAYIGNKQASKINNNRLRGLKQELLAAGLSVNTNLVIHQPGGEIENGLAGMAELLEKDTDITAVFCFNDLTAIGALHYLNGKSIRVPEDISIVGFDNIRYSAYTNPPLTTFDQPKRSIGTEAALMLMELVSRTVSGEPNDHPISKLMRGQLLARKSTKQMERSM